MFFNVGSNRNRSFNFKPYELSGAPRAQEFDEDVAQTTFLAYSYTEK